MGLKLSTKQLAAKLNLPESSLNCGRSGYGPYKDLPFLKIGASVRYDADVVDQFFAGLVPLDLSVGQFENWRPADEKRRNDLFLPKNVPPS